MIIKLSYNKKNEIIIIIKIIMIIFIYQTIHKFLKN